MVSAPEAECGLREEAYGNKSRTLCELTRSITCENSHWDASLCERYVDVVPVVL